MASVFRSVLADAYSLGKDADFTDLGCRFETILGVGFARKTQQWDQSGVDSIPANLRQCAGQPNQSIY